MQGVIDTDIQNTFLLSWANIVLAPGATPILPPTTPPGDVHGVRIVGSIFEASDGNRSVVLDERAAKFTGVSDTLIERGTARLQPTGLGRTLVGTRASKQLRLINVTQFEFDFTDSLIFGTIQEVRYSLSLEGGLFARSAARWTAGTARVVIETDVVVSGTCVVDVDESRHDKW
jgi:hypothetical protein